jgi:hypothetical protein
MAYRDFDQFYKEKNREPKVLKFQGQLAHLAPALPAAAMLMFQRWSKAAPDAKVADQDIVRLFQIIFGQARFNQWTFQPADGFQPLDMEQMMDLLSWASEAYGLASQDAADPKAPAAQG